MSQMPGMLHPSQAVLEFLRERMQLLFPLVAGRQPERVTTRVEEEAIMLEIVSRQGKVLMAQEVGADELADLERAAADPARRAAVLREVRRDVVDEVRRRRLG